jgi:hypothetical protein
MKYTLVRTVLLLSEIFTGTSLTFFTCILMYPVIERGGEPLSVARINSV